jgi:glycosyltransferase involved in cell wall biosynthesis
MLTVHGVHEWQVVPGFQDTGGQNVFVNLLSSALSEKGFKITTVNRGGYPHPNTGQPQEGLYYFDENQRILYIEDGLPEFVRKEDMGDQMAHLLEALIAFLEEDGGTVGLVISHYWDGGLLGSLLIQHEQLEVKHIWVPHSLGMLKQRNLTPDARKDLRVDERIAFEWDIFSQIDYLAATSSKIKASAENDYSYEGEFLWLPPWVDQERYYPRTVTDSDPVWDMLSEASGAPLEVIRGNKIITEISRTDETKQKDILIKAFALFQQSHPDSFLVVSIDKTNGPLAEELLSLIETENLEGCVAAVGSIWDVLPSLYAITAVYCTPSIMEGFGMSVQEAAATRVPVVSSDLVPFATEYLMGDAVSKIKTGFGSEISIGAGAMIVSPGDVEGFAGAIDLLVSDETLRSKMGAAAFNATIPYFTRDQIIQDFLDGALQANVD